MSHSCQLIQYGFTLVYARNYDKRWQHFIFLILQMLNPLDTGKIDPQSSYVSAASLLSDDIISEILKYMSYESVLAAECVCKSWLRLSAFHNLWHVLLLSHYGLSSLELQMSSCISAKRLFKMLNFQFQRYFRRIEMGNFYIPATAYFATMALATIN